MDKKNTIELNGVTVTNGEMKTFGNFFKFSVSKSSKDKKTDEWRTAYFDVLVNDGALIEQITPILGPKAKVRVAGGLSVGEYKGKTTLAIFANEVDVLEPGSGGAQTYATTPPESFLKEEDVPF